MGYFDSRRGREQQRAEKRVQSYEARNGSQGIRRMALSTQGSFRLSRSEIRDIARGKSPNLDYRYWRELNRSLDSLEED